MTEASWFDYVTINGGAGLNGTPGFLAATIVIDGSLNLSGGDPYAGGGLASQAGTYFYVDAKCNGVTGTYGASNNFTGGSQLRYVLGGGTAVTAWNGNQIGPGIWQVTFPITFGQLGSVYVFARAQADARAVVYGPGDGLRQSFSTADFNSGIRWAGITELRTTNGTVVTNYTLTSTSGFDYGAGISPAPPQFTQINPIPAGGVTLQWTDSFPRSYTVETASQLPSTNWVPAPGVSWPITTNWVSLPGATVSNAFFRLRAQ